MDTRYLKVDVIGYIMFDGVDINEYWDFVRKTFYLRDVKFSLENGHFPPGLIFRDDFGTVAMVAKDRKSLIKLEIGGT